MVEPVNLCIPVKAKLKYKKKQTNKQTNKQTQRRLGFLNLKHHPPIFPWLFQTLVPSCALQGARYRAMADPTRRKKSLRSAGRALRRVGCGRLQFRPLGFCGFGESPTRSSRFERLESGYPMVFLLFFSVVDFRGGTLPTKRVTGHYWGTWPISLRENGGVGNVDQTSNGATSPKKNSVSTYFPFRPLARREPTQSQRPCKS